MKSGFAPDALAADLADVGPHLVEIPHRWRRLLVSLSARLLAQYLLLGR